MSGPIVRKYGFPNFDQIFGKRELQHGVDDKATSPPGERPATSQGPTPTEPTPPSTPGSGEAK